MRLCWRSVCVCYYCMISFRLAVLTHCIRVIFISHALHRVFLLRRQMFARKSMKLSTGIEGGESQQNNFPFGLPFDKSHYMRMIDACFFAFCVHCDIKIMVDCPVWNDSKLFIRECGLLNGFYNHNHMCVINKAKDRILTFWNHIGISLFSQAMKMKVENIYTYVLMYLISKYTLDIICVLILIFLFLFRYWRMLL